jgi:hypothetical protein
VKAKQDSRDKWAHQVGGLQIEFSGWHVQPQAAFISDARQNLKSHLQFQSKTWAWFSI